MDHVNPGCASVLTDMSPGFCISRLNIAELLMY